jgi:glutamine transport system permease protein
MLQMSSLDSVVGLQELARRANELTVTVYRPLQIYIVLVAEYLLMILAASCLVRRLEAKAGADAWSVRQRWRQTAEKQP